MGRDEYSLGLSKLCVCPSPCKRRLVSAIRWTLLVDALLSATASLLTVLPWPVWNQAMGREAWPVGFVVPEIALRLVPLPVCLVVEGHGRHHGGAAVAQF